MTASDSIPSAALEFAYLARGCGSIYYDPDELAEDAPFGTDISVEDSLKPEVQAWLAEHSAQIMWTVNARMIEKSRKTQIKVDSRGDETYTQAMAQECGWGWRACE